MLIFYLHIGANPEDFEKMIDEAVASEGPPGGQGGRSFGARPGHHGGGGGGGRRGGKRYHARGHSK